MRALPVIAALLIAACGGPDVVEVDRGGIDNIFPAETLQDWKSLADHVAVVTVVDERPLRQSDSGMRHVWLRVERTLWSAPRAPGVPPVFAVRDWGWTDDDVPVKAEGAARFTLHRHYLAPLVFYDEDPGAPIEWAPQADLAVMPVRRGRIDTRGVWAGEAQRRLHALTVDQAAAQVRAEPAHPAAARNRDLRPQRRLRAMHRAGAFQDPRPG